MTFIWPLKPSLYDDFLDVNAARVVKSYISGTIFVTYVQTHLLMYRNYNFYP